MTSRPDRTRNERNRRYRRRQKLGVVPTTVDLDVDVVPSLIASGQLTEEEAADPELLAERLGHLIEAALLP